MHSLSNSFWLLLLYVQNGRTALHFAVTQAIVDNDLDVVRFLIDRGADVNLKDEVRFV